MPRTSYLPLFICSFLLFTCGLDDTVFYEGTGNLKGTVLIGGQPIPGAEVNWVGAPFTTNPALSQSDGTFKLTQVPVGKAEIIIRAIDQSHGLRLDVRAVSGHTTQLGPLELQEAPPLRITVTDPDLPIRDARLHLAEIPGLEGRTDFRGQVTLACVPRSGCYQPKVESKIFPFPFQTSSCPTSSDKWTEGYLVNLIPGPAQAQAQVYHAYQLIADIVANLSSCNGLCFVPDWWAVPSTPPCAEAISSDQSESELLLYLELRSLFQKLSQLPRFASASTSIELHCPAPMTALCIDGLCSLEPDNLERVHLLSTGSGPKNCFSGKLSALESVQELAEAANCIGIAPPEWQDNGLFVLFQPGPALVPTHIGTVQGSGNVLAIHLWARLSLGAALSAHSEDEPPETRGWALLWVDSHETGKPKLEDTFVLISWVEPVP